MFYYFYKLFGSKEESTNSNDLIKEEFKEENNLVKLEVKKGDEASVNAILVDNFDILNESTKIVDTNDIEITRNENKWNENYKRLKLANFFG